MVIFCSNCVSVRAGSPLSRMLLGMLAVIELLNCFVFQFAHCNLPIIFFDNGKYHSDFLLWRLFRLFEISRCY